MTRPLLSATDRIIRRQYIRKPPPPYHYLYQGNHFRVFLIEGIEYEYKITTDGISLYIKKFPTPPQATIQDGTEFYAWYQHWETRRKQAEEMILSEP